MIHCQRCQKRPATVHMTEIEGTTKKEVHLCESCANETGLSVKAGFAAELLQQLIGGRGGREGGEHGKLVCPTCGTTYATFRARGRFGCPDDYAAFRPALAPLLEKIHGTARHVGKRPAGGAAAGPAAPVATAPAVPALPAGPGPADRLRELKDLLQRAVRDEDYERAAELRDQIRHLEVDGGTV